MSPELNLKRPPSHLTQLFRVSAMGGRNAHQHLSKIAFLTFSLMSILSGAVAEESRQTYVVRYKKGDRMIPVTVVLDYRKQTEYVMNMHPRTTAKSVTFYDFKERMIAYKDLDNKECFIGRLTHETLREESAILENIKSPVEDKPLVLTLEPNRPSLTPTEVKNIAGHKTAVFCRRMNTWMLQSHGDHRRSKRQTGEFVRRSYSHHGRSSHNFSYHGHESYERYPIKTRNGLRRTLRNGDGSARTRHNRTTTANLSRLDNHELQYPKHLTLEAQRKPKGISALKPTHGENNHKVLRGQWSTNVPDQVVTDTRSTLMPLLPYPENTQVLPEDEKLVAWRKGTTYHTNPNLQRLGHWKEKSGRKVDDSTGETDFTPEGLSSPQKHSETDPPSFRNGDAYGDIPYPYELQLAHFLTTERPLSVSHPLTSETTAVTSKTLSRLSLDHRLTPDLAHRTGHRESPILNNTAEELVHLRSQRAQNISTSSPSSSGLALGYPLRTLNNQSYVNSDHIDVQESSALYTDSLVVPEQPIIPHWYSTIAKEISIPLDFSYSPHKENLHPYAGGSAEHENYTQNYELKAPPYKVEEIEEGQLQSLHRGSGTGQDSFRNSEHRLSTASVTGQVRPVAFDIRTNRRNASHQEIYNRNSTTFHALLEPKTFDIDSDATRQRPNDTHTHSLIYRSHNHVASYGKPLEVSFDANENLSHLQVFTDFPTKDVEEKAAAHALNNTNESLKPNYPYIDPKDSHGASESGPVIISKARPSSIAAIIPGHDNGAHSFRNSLLIPNVNVSEGVPKRQERLPNVLQLFTPGETVVDVGKSPNSRGRSKPSGSSSVTTKTRFFRMRNKTRGTFTPKKSIRPPPGITNLAPTAFSVKHRTQGNHYGNRKDLRLGVRSGSGYHHRSYDALPPGVSVHPRHPQAPYAELASESAKRTMIANSLQHGVDNQLKHHHQRHYRKRNRNFHPTANGETSSCCRSGRRRDQQHSTSSCCQEAPHHRNLVNIQQGRNPVVANKDGSQSAEDRCMKEKMCRTVYKSTKQVLVCRNVDIAGC